MKKIFLIGFVIPAISLAQNKVELGKMLFFDKRLSVNNTISCQSCHDVIGRNSLKASGTDGLSQSVGVYGRLGSRNAPTVWNSALRPSLFWDGRAKSLEEQAAGPIMNHVEMGMPSMDEVIKKLSTIQGYRTAFKNAFNEKVITEKKIVEAIAEYEKTLLAKNSPFDRYLNGDKNALSRDAQLGWKKFTSYSCIACHGAATFLDQDFFVRFPMNSKTIYESKYDIKSDRGRFEFTKNRYDMHRWRVPSLRNIELTSPYLHNGSIESLEEVVKVMGKTQLNRDLTTIDIKELVAFLKSLTGDNPAQTEPKLPTH